MNWYWHTPTEIYFGPHVIADHFQAMAKLGPKCLIVTGRGGSARRNGALEDITAALGNLNIKWALFDEVEANPSLATARRGAHMAQLEQANFIIGIGGGSPLDAAKAIAVLVVNDFNDEQLFTQPINEALPIVAIPTTAGTGSEVTPYSILTYDAIENKKSIFSPLITPVIAYLDPLYTYRLPFDVTVDTAVDAFSHAYEGFLSRKANRLSDDFALLALGLLGPRLRELTEDSLCVQWREDVLYGSMLAGLVISHTGTSIPHALGYSLTYFKDIPHGRANGMILPAYTRFNLERSADPKIKLALSVAGFTSPIDFAQVMISLVGKFPDLSSAEMDKFITIGAQAKNIHNNLVIPTAADLRLILEDCH